MVNPEGWQLLRRVWYLAQTGSFSWLHFCSIALHLCNFIFSSSKTSSVGSIWEGVSVPCSLLSHWKLEKRVCCSCSVWRNKLLCELWNLMRLLSCHFVYTGFPRLLLPIFSNPVSPSTCSAIEGSCGRLELSITQLPANKITYEFCQTLFQCRWLLKTHSNP